MFETLQDVGIAEVVRTEIRLWIKPMNLCGCDNEERERGVGADVNDTMLLMSGADLLDGDTDTSTVSQGSEVGQWILCNKEDIGKYDIWYGVVCKDIMSFCMSAGWSLAGGRDTVSCLVITVKALDRFVGFAKVPERWFGCKKNPWTCVYVIFSKETCCLLLIDKTSTQQKTYIWVSVWWKTKRQRWGIFTSHIHWFVWGTGTPKDRDEVNRREGCECDGWVWERDTKGVPSIFKVNRSAAALVRLRILSIFD
jgi:hypothetical protein